MLSGFMTKLLGKVGELHLEDGGIVSVFGALLKIGSGCFAHAGTLVKKQMVRNMINRLK